MRVTPKERCEHYGVEIFDMGPINERWFKCALCGEAAKRKPHLMKRKKRS